MMYYTTSGHPKICNYLGFLKICKKWSEPNGKFEKLSRWRWKLPTGLIWAGIFFLCQQVKTGKKKWRMYASFKKKFTLLTKCF